MTTRNHWIHALAVQRGISVKEVENALRLAQRANIVPESIQHVRSICDESLRLYLTGETLASMWAGQAMWEAAASLHYASHEKKQLLAGRKLVQVAIEANAAKKKAANLQHANWQKRAESLWQKPLHAKKSASDIARLIDDTRWDTIRRHIRKPV